MLGDALIGVIRQRDIRRALERGDKWTTVAEVMRRDIPSLGMDDSLTAVQDQLIQANSPVGAVYEDHHFMGLISFEDIERAFRTTRVRGKTASSVI
jgi:predicted transcriptional regulator